MANADENIRIYGGEEDAVCSAPMGTTLPTDLSELSLAFLNAGLLSEDGIELEQSSEKAEVKVHQGMRIARTKVLGTVHTFKFTCSEENAVTHGLMYPAATSESAGGVTTIRGLEKMKRDERVFIVDTHDEDIHDRLIYTRAEVTERGTIAKKADEATLYEFTVTSYGEVIRITNNPALTVE